MKIYKFEHNVKGGDTDWDEYDGDLIEDDFCSGYLIIESFAEYLKTAKYTEIVATTAY